MLVCLEVACRAQRAVPNRTAWNQSQWLPTPLSQNQPTSDWPVRKHVCHLKERSVEEKVAFLHFGFDQS